MTAGISMGMDATGRIDQPVATSRGGRGQTRYYDRRCRRRQVGGGDVEQTAVGHQVQIAHRAGAVPCGIGQPLSTGTILEDRSATRPVGRSVGGEERAGRVGAWPEWTEAVRHLLVIRAVLIVPTGEEQVVGAV